MTALKFLVVDDASFIRDMLKKQLRHAFANCLVVDVPGVAKAQAALKQHRFDLILCDWEMPEVTGEEFLRWLREQPAYQDLPFIMVTSRGERDFVVKAVQAGVNGYIGKPFKPETLVSKVSKVLAKAGVDLDAAQRSRGETQGIAGASVDILTGGSPAKPAARSPAKAQARGQAQLNFSGFTAQCVIRDLSLQMCSGLIRREEQLPALLEPVVVSIQEVDGGDVARLNGYVHSLQAAEPRIDATAINLVIRFVDDDPAKMDHLSRYIARL
ncbi:MAG TPA: response regulator [Spongiibacteraceae bacterium]|jgi:CheY-like chemotaxis protein|nr:response regulator [Spongiibacteraceae bacterium]HUH37469.1 response regulator [Spongiibacteraceae bacterium]